jgi:integrase
MSKAKHGMGHVWYDATRERWRGRVMVKGRLAECSDTTEAKVRATIKKWVAQAKRTGRPLNNQRYTVKTWLAHWMETRTRDGLAGATVRGYEFDIRLRIVPALGHIRIADLTPNDVQDWIGVMRDHDYAGKTIERTKMVLSMALGDAVRLELLDRNVVSLVRGPSPKPNDRTKIVYSVEQARAFVAAAWDVWYGPLLITALTTGLRLGELLALQWDAIDFERRLIRAHWNQPQRGGRSRTKTDTGARLQAIGAITLRALQLAKHRQANLPIDSGRVFVDPTGRAVEPTAIYPPLRRLAAAAGVPYIPAHGLRRTWATLQGEDDANARAIQDALGHSSIEMTYHYIQRRPSRVEDLADLAAGMDRILGA